MGAKTDVMHDVRMGCTDDAWMGAMTDVMHDVWMDCVDGAQTGAMTDVMHDVWTVGDFTTFSCMEFTVVFSPQLQGIFDGFAADGDELMDGLSV